ncbi:MAG TPA: hypothetical protein PLJ26_06785, partial [Candidatus Omnitrophota bacterium]|nr:hypothetical protein [Candidatus Omnitrophota bacterium]
MRAQTSSLAVSAIAGKKIESFRNEQELLASLPIGSSFIPFDKLDEIDDERYHHMRLAQARFDLLAKHLDKVDALRREKTRDTVIWQPDNRRFTLVYDRKELSFSIYLSSLLCHGDRTGDFHETWDTLIIEDGRSNTTRISTSSRLGLQFGLRDYACGESDIFHSRLIQHVFFNATDETLYLGMHSIWLLGLYRIIKVPNREAGVSPTFAFVSTDHMEKHGYILENFDGGIGGQSLLRPFGFIKNLRLWPDQPAYPAAANPRMQSNAVPIILTFIIAWVIPAIYPMFVWWNTRNIYMSIVLGCVGYSFAVYLISKLPRSKALAVWCLMMLDVFGRRAGTCCLHILRLANDQAIVRRFDRVSVDYLTDRDVDNAAPIFARIERGSLVSILNNWIERFEADKARQILAHPAIPDDLREYASRRVALRLEVQQGILENARERAHGRAYAQAFQETIYWKGLPDLQKIWFQDGRSASLYDLARNLTLDDFRQALQYAQEFQARLTSMNMVDDKTVSTWIPAACRSVTSLPAFQQYLDALAVSIIQNHIIEDFQHIKWELALYSIIEQDELLLRMFDKHGLHKDAPAGCWTFVYFRTVLAPAPENIKKAVSKLYIEETTSDWQNRSADERTQYLRDLARENELTENDWILLNHAVDPETAGGQQVRDGGLLIPVLAFAAGVFIFVILIPWLTYTGGKEYKDFPDKMHATFATWPHHVPQYENQPMEPFDFSPAPLFRRIVYLNKKERSSEWFSSFYCGACALFTVVTGLYAFAGASIAGLPYALFVALVSLFGSAGLLAPFLRNAVMFPFDYHAVKMLMDPERKEMPDFYLKRAARAVSRLAKKHRVYAFTRLLRDDRAELAAKLLDVPVWNKYHRAEFRLDLRSDAFLREKMRSAGVSDTDAREKIALLYDMRTAFPQDYLVERREKRAPNAGFLAGPIVHSFIRLRPFFETIVRDEFIGMVGNLSLEDLRKALGLMAEMNLRLASLGIYAGDAFRDGVPEAARNVRSFEEFKCNLQAVDWLYLLGAVESRYWKWLSEKKAGSIDEKEQKLAELCAEADLINKGPAGIWTHAYLRTVLRPDLTHKPVHDRLSGLVADLYVMQGTQQWKEYAVAERADALQEYARAHNVNDSQWHILNHAVDLNAPVPPLQAAAQQDGGKTGIPEYRLEFSERKPDTVYLATGGERSSWVGLARVRTRGNAAVVSFWRTYPQDLKLRRGRIFCALLENEFSRDPAITELIVHVRPNKKTGKPCRDVVGFLRSLGFRGPLEYDGTVVMAKSLL